MIIIGNNLETAGCCTVYYTRKRNLEVGWLHCPTNILFLKYKIHIYFWLL